MVKNWILVENLEPFCRLVSALCEYGFDDADWAAISYGIRDTDYEEHNWFSYVFEGDIITTYVSCAIDPGTSVVFVEVASTPDFEEKVEVLMLAASEFMLTKANRGRG